MDTLPFASPLPDSGIGSATRAVIEDVSAGWSDDQRARVEAVLSRVMNATPSTPAPAALDPLTFARALEAGFRHAAADAIAQALHAGLAVPFASPDQTVTWLHPDGSLRDARDA